MTQPATERHDPSEEHRKDVVTITVDNVPYEIHRGRQTVADIKALAGIPPADHLVLVRADNEPEELKDDGSIVIKGGERFLSHPKDSGSS
jgi:hypothetical protein